MKFAKISEAKFRILLKSFCLDETATNAAQITSVHTNTAKNAAQITSVHTNTAERIY